MPRFTAILLNLVHRNWIEVWEGNRQLLVEELHTALTQPSAWVADGDHRMLELITTDHWDELTKTEPVDRK